MDETKDWYMLYTNLLIDHNYIKSDLKALVEEMHIDMCQSCDANMWHYEAVKRYHDKLKQLIEGVGDENVQYFF